MCKGNGRLMNLLDSMAQPKYLILGSRDVMHVILVSPQTDRPWWLKIDFDVDLCLKID